MIDLTNEILTNLKNKLINVDVKSPYDNSKTTFPTVTIKEISNTTDFETVDSNGETHSLISFEINIFDIGNNKESSCKKIRNSIDLIMTQDYKMNRDFSAQVENYADTNVFRWILRYSCVVNKNKVIYRR